MHPHLFITPGVAAFAMDVDTERQRQLGKFGEQHHPDGTGLPIYQHGANRYRAHADRAAASGHLAWRDILMEKVYEALAESDPEELRTELVQVAAVCAAWIADLDSRETNEQRADREETERDHAAGDHTHCGMGCETEFPSEQLRNFVIAKGYPGTAGALDELLRRAAVPPKPVADRTDLRDRIRRAICEAEGFGWDTDLLEPDEYGSVADAVLAVLPAAATGAPHAAPGEPTTAADYLASVLAYLAHGGTLSSPEATIAEALRLHTAEQPVPADRAAVLREAATAAYQLPTPNCAEMGSLTSAWGNGVRAVAAQLRRMADEAQQATTEGSTS